MRHLAESGVQGAKALSDCRSGIDVQRRSEFVGKLFQRNAFAVQLIFLVNECRRPSEHFCGIVTGAVLVFRSGTFRHLLLLRLVQTKDAILGKNKKAAEKLLQRPRSISKNDRSVKTIVEYCALFCP